MEEKKQFIFGSKYPGYMIVLEVGGPKYIPPNTYIPKVPFEGYTFVDGIFRTEDESLAKRLKEHRTYGKDFWEITSPEDAKRVNVGRKIEVTGNVKGTSALRSR